MRLRIRLRIVETYIDFFLFPCAEEEFFFYAINILSAAVVLIVWLTEAFCNTIHL